MFSLGQISILINLYILLTFIEFPYIYSLRDVTMDIAEDRPTRQDRAYAVEQCVCPVGHRGLSCEDCDTGYTRSGGGVYLGLCVPCECNGHSSDCNPETGVCRVGKNYILNSSGLFVYIRWVRPKKK